MSGLLLLAVFSFHHQISIVLSGHLNLTTIISVDPQEQEEYFRYFKHLPHKTPLHSYLNVPRQLYVLCKAAEFAALNYKSAKEESKFTLRRILSVKDVQDNQTFKYRLLLQDDQTGKQEQADFVVFTRSTNVGGKYQVQVEAIKQMQKRSDVIENQSEPCDRLSQSANCSSCGYKGVCHKGTAHISPWLALALKTQRKLQVNMSLERVQMLAAHNAFNNRADGYGVQDDCHWPPPYNRECIDLANQEFSFTDLLQMGIRALEIDPWWCFGKVRMSHALKHAYLGCGPWDREFKDGIREIAEWSKRPENKNEIIRLYLEDGPDHTQGHDDLLNGPIKDHFGEKVLTPDDIQTYFHGKWPTLFEMQKTGKTVLISSGNSYNHQGKYIHSGYWRELTTNHFLSYENCTEAVISSEPLRVYSDSTEYGPFWNGPKKTGTILNYMEYLKCGVVYPAADQINPDLLNTAIFTWARNQPITGLSRESCVVLCAEDKRWHLQQCATQNPFACVETNNAENEQTNWVISSTKGPYSKPACPDGFVFSVPRNAVEHYKLLEKMSSQDVWLNLEHYIPLIIEE